MPRKPNTSGNHYNDPFPKRLRELMRKNGTRQEDLKSVLGSKTRQSVTGYTDGTTLPTIDKIEQIAKYFNVSADYLLGLTPHKTPSADIRAICDYTGLSEASVQRIVHFKNLVSYFEDEPISGLDVSILDELIQSDSFLKLLIAIGTAANTSHRAIAARSAESARYVDEQAGEDKFMDTLDELLTIIERSGFPTLSISSVETDAERDMVHATYLAEKCAELAVKRTLLRIWGEGSQEDRAEIQRDGMILPSKNKDENTDK